jgi:hypothetical protein
MPRPLWVVWCVCVCVVGVSGVGCGCSLSPKTRQSVAVDSSSNYHDGPVIDYDKHIAMQRECICQLELNSSSLTLQSEKPMCA